MGRTSTARERILAAACELMLNRGYGSIGVAEICARAEVKKGSFYHFFESKQALTIEAIDVHWSEQRPAWVAALSGPEPALSRIERLIQAQVEAQRHPIVNGCLFGNLTLELSAQDQAVLTHLEGIFEEQIKLIWRVLDEAAAEKTIPPDSADYTVARSIVAQLEGMVMFAKLRNNPDLLDDLWNQILRLLRAEAQSTLE